MPELPDITIYLEALRARALGATLLEIRVYGPSWLRTVEPTRAEAEGRRVRGLRRIGKRIVFELEEELFLVLHLMVAGRLRWRGIAKPTASTPRAARQPRNVLGELVFSTGTLVATEAGTRKRASLYLLRGEAALAEHDPGGLEPVGAARVVPRPRGRGRSRLRSRRTDARRRGARPRRGRAAFRGGRP